MVMDSNLIFQIVAAVLAVIGSGFGIYWYKAKATKAQREKVQQWLLYAVSEAEKQLGSGTGQLKLATVYNMFLLTFPKIAKVMPFAVFSALVDKALETMEDMIKNNSTIAKVIEKGPRYDALISYKFNTGMVW